MECHDTRPVILLEEQQQYFDAPGFQALAPMVLMIDVMGDDYGMLRNYKSTINQQHANNIDDNEDHVLLYTTTFWFMVPLLAAVALSKWSCSIRTIGNPLQNCRHPDIIRPKTTESVGLLDQNACHNFVALLPSQQGLVPWLKISVSNDCFWASTNDLSSTSSVNSNIAPMPCLYSLSSLVKL